MRRIFCSILAGLLCVTARAAVVRPAPNFEMQDLAHGSSLKSYRGQTVVLLITRSAREKKFRTMVYRLELLYGQFSTEKVIFVAAIETGPQEVKSNIPFALAANPQQVAADYGVQGPYGIAVIGIDGNVDLITEKMIAAERVRDTVFNNYESQSAARKPLGQ
jgi:hypothetical protein